MSPIKEEHQKLTAVLKPVELLPWERDVLAVLRSLSSDGRGMMISTCHAFARRQNERKPVRPTFRLISGGQA